MSVPDWESVGRDCSPMPRSGALGVKEEAEFCIGDDRYIGDPRYRFLPVGGERVRRARPAVSRPTGAVATAGLGGRLSLVDGAMDPPVRRQVRRFPSPQAATTATSLIAGCNPPIAGSNHAAHDLSCELGRRAGRWMAGSCTGWTDEIAFVHGPVDSSRCEWLSGAQGGAAGLALCTVRSTRAGVSG